MTNSKISNYYKYERAEKRLKQIKGFYVHLFWYLIVNMGFTTAIIYGKIWRPGYSFSLESLTAHLELGYFSIWFWWGIGMFFHWYGVFGKNLFFSKEWEQRKIQELMNNEN